MSDDVIAVVVGDKYDELGHVVARPDRCMTVVGLGDDQSIAAFNRIVVDGRDDMPLGIGDAEEGYRVIVEAYRMVEEGLYRDLPIWRKISTDELSDLLEKVENKLN